MNKQLITFGIIGILFVISISGCLENNKNDNESKIDIKKEVSILTDKINYFPLENINFTIFNNLDESIYILECKPFNKQYWLPVLNIEKKYNNIWYHISESPVCEKSRFKEFNSQSKDINNLNYSVDSPGLYRLNVTIRLNCNESIEKYGWELEEYLGEKLCEESMIIYSNEFTIKNLENISVITNKNIYERGENISITIFNNRNNTINLMDVYNGIEIFINNSWKNLWDYTNYNCSCDQTCFWGKHPELNSRENISFQWNQKIWTNCDSNASLFNLDNSTFIFAYDGTYRICVEIGYSNFKDYVYSNIFNIVK